MTFPQKLQSERLRLRLTQVQAASLLGISASALGKWETGTKTPKLLTQEGALARLGKLNAPKANSIMGVVVVSASGQALKLSCGHSINLAVIGDNAYLIGSATRCPECKRMARPLH